MNARTIIEYVLVVLFVLFAASLLLGQALGQPIGIGYVETGSMSPELEPGDGFIAVPIQVADPVEPGDVIVFDAENLHGGGLTTHRVVDETPAGFITKGDANAVTDQDGSEPPVKRGQVVAVASQLGGDVVALPHVGRLASASTDAITTTQRQLAIVFGTRVFLGSKGLAYVLFVFGILAYAVSAVRAGTGRTGLHRSTDRDAGVLDTRIVVTALALLLVTVITLSMVVPGGVHHFDLVSSDTDGDGPTVIPKGSTETLVFQVPSNGPFPVVVYLDPHTEGVNVTPRRMVIDSHSTQNATIDLTAPPETGYYERAIVEHRYLAVIPPSTIDTLYRIHPWLPILVIDALAALGFVILALGLVGWGPVRVDTSGDTPFMVRLRRRFR